MIKRIVTAVLVLSVLLSFSGCTASQQTAKPLRICLDMAFTGNAKYSGEMLCEELKVFLEDDARAFSGVGRVEIELIPKKGEERTAVIDRIRTEIENGGGPDLFLISNATQDTIGENALFPFPEQAMAKGTFLSLDEYIKNAEFTDWNKLYSVILNAGKTEQGQMIVPLSYTLPVTCFKQSEVQHTPSATLTWADMVDDETWIMQASALWLRSRSRFYPQWEDTYLEYILGESVDFEKGELLFEEEELTGVLRDLVKLCNAETRGKFDALPAHYQVSMNVRYRMRSVGIDVLYDGIDFDTPLTMVPLYSTDGGVTATVVSFAAVNANTKHAQAAFQVLDLLLCRPMQMHSELYQSFLGDLGMPMHTNLVLDGEAIRTYKGERSMPEASSDAYRSVLNEITHVRFRNALEAHFDALYKAFYAQGMRSGLDDADRLKELVAEGYVEMQEAVKAAAE